MIVHLEMIRFLFISHECKKNVRNIRTNICYILIKLYITGMFLIIKTSLMISILININC